jgi:hypothetical protein
MYFHLTVDLAEKAVFMGLMYVFPVSEDETDFIEIKDEILTLKTYGLPYIFWFYGFSCVAVITFMFLAIKSPVLKLAALGDETDVTLAYALLTFICILPAGILGLFFYEKRILKDKKTISLIHKVFGLTLFSEKIAITNEDIFLIEPFLSSPNIAKIINSNEHLGFQNKGYFVLWLKFKEGKKIQIDRHSRKADLEKLKIILEKN